MLQRHAIEKLHGDEGLTVVFTNVVDCADVRMIQCRGSLCFALETGQCLSVSGNLLRQELQCDETMEPSVLSLIYNPHATAAQLLDYSIMGDGLADEL